MIFHMIKKQLKKLSLDDPQLDGKMKILDEMMK